ncbi:MAG: hypothetical protein H0X37_07180 [Herpetosiphonaceae bacterium]|nr:hypothetical protein [Herpetosiphonaceae bacterium]
MPQANSAPELTLRDRIEAWKAKQDQDEFLAIINDVCNDVVSTIRDGSGAERGQLATDLAVLRKIQPLPFPGTDDFLHVLQLMLRNQPGMARQAAQLRAELPEAFAVTLTTMERLIAGETVPEEPEGTPAAAMLPVEQPDPVEVLEQVAPAFEQVTLMLHDPQFGSRAMVAQYVEKMATQATEGETAGSPWLDAAAGLRALAALLRDETPNVEMLTPTYRKLVEEARG